MKCWRNKRKDERNLESNLVRSYSAAGVSTILWASAFPAVKFALDYYSPEALMLLRFIVATAFLLGFCAIKKIPPPGLRDMPMFALSGFVGLFLYMWAFNTGTGMVTSGISSFIIASSPVFTLMLSIWWLREKTGLRIWLGVLISLVGIVIIGATQVTEMRLNLGFWLLLFAAVTTGIYSVMQKYIVQKYSAMQATAYTMAFGTFFMLIFMPSLVREFPTAPLYANLLVVYLGLFPAALAYFLWGYALAKTHKTIYVTSFLYLVPFFASVIAFFWLGETLPLLALFGGVMVALGMVVTNKRA